LRNVISVHVSTHLHTFSILLIGAQSQGKMQLEENEASVLVPSSLWVVQDVEATR